MEDPGKLPHVLKSKALLEIPAGRFGAGVAHISSCARDVGMSGAAERLPLGFSGFAWFSGGFHLTHPKLGNLGQENFAWVRFGSNKAHPRLPAKTYL